MSTDCVMTLDNVTLVRVALCTDRITRLATNGCKKSAKLSE